nr:putative reverse transcriptase domain-containing protein [Tanacetum cinerariifolium]
MRQRRWIELLSDYECEIKYHPRKANVVADSLSRKERLKPRRVRAMSITIHYRLNTKILKAQGEASKDLKAPAKWLKGLETHFERRDDGGIYFFDRIWIPSVGGVRKLIMDEAHTSRYSIHPGADKMYYDLRDLYWWRGMRRDIAEYVRRCLTCSKVKVEHQKPSGLLQQPEIPEWKWEKITMDLVTKLPRSNGSHQKIYVDKRRNPLEFKVEDRVLLKELSYIHDTFHVSNLKKCLAEPDVQVPLEEIEIDENMCFVKEPIEIVKRDVKKLKQRRIPLVKVYWNSRQGAEYTWEREDQFQKKYSYLFTKPVPSSSVVT